MKLTSALVAGVALAAVATGGSAQAKTYRYGSVPPVSGTIQLAPETFASGGAERLGWRRHRFAGYHHYGPYYGYQGGAYRQLWRGGYNTAGSEVFWNRRVEFYGEGNDTLALLVTGTGANSRASHRYRSYDVSDATPALRRGRDYAAVATAAAVLPTTGWGTADSATTGGSYPPPSPIHSASVRTVYGDAGNWASDRGLTYGYAPTGGLGYYNSGSPGRMAYYGSSSSAGPGGSPGGLATYSSGSYGPGPGIIHIGGQGGQWSAARSLGPHIINLGQDGSDVQQD